MVLLLLRPPPACKGCYTSLNSNVDLLLLMRISWYEIGRSVSKFQCGSIITEMDAVTNKLWPISKFQCGSIITCATLEKNKASVSSKFQCGSIITQRDDQRIFLLHPLNSNVDLLLPGRHGPVSLLWHNSKFQCGSIITKTTIWKHPSILLSKFQCGSIITFS